MSYRRNIADLVTHPTDEAFNHAPTKHRLDMARRMAELEKGKSLYKGYYCEWNGKIAVFPRRLHLYGDEEQAISIDKKCRSSSPR